MSIRDYDLVVAGGGPAGSAAAITGARAGQKVLLLERGGYPRHKVCGEFVSAESVGLLHWLGVADISARPAIREVRIFLPGATRALTARLENAAVSIPRYDLDLKLWESAKAAGAECRQQATVMAVHRRKVPAGFDVEIEEGGTTRQVPAKAMIDASGRWSRLKEHGEPANGASAEKWIGLKAHFWEGENSGGARATTKGEDSVNSTDLYFFSEGYCGVQAVSAGRVNACALVLPRRAAEAVASSGDTGAKDGGAMSSSAIRSLDDVFRLHPALQARSAGWKREFPDVATAPVTFDAPRVERHGILLAGDAAGFIDPFAGDGISLALHSGVMAAKALLHHVADEPSEARLAAAIAEYSTEYDRRLRPAFRNAARVRGFVKAPELVRGAALLLAQGPVLRWVMRRTRIEEPLSGAELAGGISASARPL